MNSVGVGVTVVGIIAAGVGYIGLLHTDGVGNNALYAVIALVGSSLAIVGARTRPLGQRVKSVAASLPPEAKRRLGLGIGCVVLACLTPIPFDRHQSHAILDLDLAESAPVAIAIVAAIIGIGLALRATLPQDERQEDGRSWVKVVVFAIYSGLLVMTLVICFLQLTTVQALRAIGMLVLSAAGLTFMMVARGSAGKTSKTWQLIIGLLVAVRSWCSAFVIRADSERRAVPHRHVRRHDDRRDGHRRQHAGRVLDGEATHADAQADGWASGCS